MSQTFNHVAVTVPADLLEGTGRDELLGFYAEVLGWTEYGGFLQVFRLRFRLPLTLELAYLAKDAGGRS